ncbi:MAG: hypothetical protein AAFQ22_13620 [Pseudomonadota bacterium]
MKYIPEQSVFFLHIPKNAGKSVHAALDQYTASYAAYAADLGISEIDAESMALSKPRPDQAPGTFSAGLDLANLGRVHPSHLPLFVLQQACPQTWATLNNAAFSFAMTRDPRERFLSALMQRMKEFGDAGAIRADDVAVKNEAEKVCAWLGERERFADLEYVHFIRQSDFVEHEGKRVITDLFPVDRTDVLYKHLHDRTGLIAEVPRSHARRQPKQWARAAQPIARFAARRLLTPRLKQMIYPIWTGSALFTDASKTYDAVDLGAATEAFLKEYYARDAALHAEALAGAKAVDTSSEPENT